MIGVEELVDEKFEGSCILMIYQAFVGSCKSISLSVEEILARKIEIGKSYFADESDEHARLSIDLTGQLVFSIVIVAAQGF